jgi:uncharacterized protein YmfQ (DUF2313 family)
VPDRHIRRGGAEYFSALAALLPKGLAWPRNLDSVLMRTVKGLAQYWGFVDGRAADLLERETDPRITLEMLSDWERAFGLPDPCLAEPLTIGERQRILVHRITMLGAQSRAFFIGVANELGHTIRIREYAPFMCGISRCGITLDWVGNPRWQLGPPENRFYWTVRVDTARLIWFRVTKGQVGIDPHLRIGLSSDLECILGRWKPAQTLIIFDYSGLSRSDPMAGTP